MSFLFRSGLSPLSCRGLSGGNWCLRPRHGHVDAYRSLVGYLSQCPCVYSRCDLLFSQKALGTHTDMILRVRPSGGEELFGAGDFSAFEVTQRLQTKDSCLVTRGGGWKPGLGQCRLDRLTRGTRGSRGAYLRGNTVICSLFLYQRCKQKPQIGETMKMF